MTQTRSWPLAVLGLLAAGVVASPVLAQGAKKSDAVVKTAATAGKPDADGKQVVSITVEPDAGWHVYANPVGNEDLTSVQTTVTITAKNKLEEVKIDYPEGKLHKDDVVGNYRTYEEKVTIKATVLRAKGDTGPLEVTLKFQACSDKQCLLPANVKLTVE
jgi:hypothetical protein